MLELDAYVAPSGAAFEAAAGGAGTGSRQVTAGRLWLKLPGIG